MADQSCSFWQSAGEVVLEQLTRTKVLGGTTLLKQLCDVSYFIRIFRAHMRFGRLSRASLSLLRLQWNGCEAECDWLARLPEPWDAELPRNVRERHASLQTLEDAMEVRRLLFCLLPEIDRAGIRVYRQAVSKQPELIVVGTVTREDVALRNIPSVAMRAKLCGFRFELDDGVLETLDRQSCKPRSI